MKAGIILMARIKYQEAIGLEVKRGRPPVGTSIENKLTVILPPG